MSRFNYRPEEEAEMHFIYGLCVGNASEAAREYRRRYPDRRTPNPHTFINTGGGKPDFIPPNDALDKVANILGANCDGYCVQFGGDAEVEAVEGIVTVEEIETLEELATVNSTFVATPHAPGLSPRSKSKFYFSSVASKASAPSWSRVMMATDFAPVCPQSLPAREKSDPQSLGRQRYMERLEPFLAHESEDCLYLNIYVPYREQKPKKFPVLVFIHGDSFEWSSGNPYDGRILASYGNIMVITFNYRLGILGFMKPSMTEYVYNNNGLLDQLAALQWIKDNIEDLNGDPESVTLMGHGTGAACVSFLMLSPITNGLFHRAILMSGSALSDWAMTKDPTQSTSQVAQGLGCNPTSINLMSCLQNKSLADIQKIQILAREFETPLGAVVAGSFIPDRPLKIMASYPNLLSKYQLLCGVTEFESYHDFGAIELEHGILDTQRDEFIAKYADLIYEGAGDVALKEILKQYSPSMLDPQRWNVETNRDVILNLFSDARTLAPLVNFANYHSKANRQSYFYVFGHNSISTHYAALNKSVHGEELPYVFGVPLGGCKTHLHSEYTPKEKLLSEAIMRLWTNFVKIGTPNTQSVNEYFTLDRRQWNQYNVEWPEYNVEHQSYLKLGIPPHISSFYRSNYTKFWNEMMPTKMIRFIHDPLYEFPSLPITHKPKATHKVQDPIKNEIRTPHIINTPRSNTPAHGRVRPNYQPHHPTDNNSNNQEIQSFKQSHDSQTIENINVYSTTANPKSNDKRVQAKSSAFTISLIALLGILFLAVNVGICATICLKKRRTNSLRAVQISNTTRAEIGEVDVIGHKSFNDDKNTLKTLKNSCSVIKLMSLKKIRGNSQTCKKKPVTCKTPKSDDSGGFRERFQLRRHLSTSTLDAHTKVRDWIANEVMHRCSPNKIRKSNSELDNIQNLSTTKPFTRSEEILSESKSLRINRFITNVNYLEKEPHCDCSIKYSENKVESSENNSNIGSHSTTSSNKKTKNISLVKGAGTFSESLKSKGSQSLKSRTVSVAIDATPSARTNSILQQEPIELTKSFENQKHSEDENTIQCKESEIKETLKKINYDVLFTNEITMSVKNETKPLNVYHTHSTSDPVTNINCRYLSSNDFLDNVLPPVTFRNDINVTSKDDGVDVQLTTTDALLTIKRRNFPKVLPDLPQSQKRFSLQPTEFQTFRSYTESIKNELEHPKIPPIPPPRTSTLDRQITFQYSKPLSSFEAASYPLDYENIEKLSLPTDECLHTFQTVDNCTTPIKREYPKVIISSSDFSSNQMPTYLTPTSPSQCLVSKVPRVTLPDDFHSHDLDFSPVFASVFSDDEFTDFSGNVEEDKLIQELIGGIDALSHKEDLLDSKGPAKHFENKLEIVPVKVNAGHTLIKIKEDYVGTTDLQLPNLSGFAKTAQIKPNHGINKLKQRSESIHRPPEKTVKVIQKGFMKPSVIINRGITNVVKSNHRIKNDAIGLEHSNSGSSNATEASIETVKESEITKKV